MPQIKPEIESFARIKVIGIGGSGCNAVTRMVKKRIKGIDFIGINTDAQALHFCKAPEKILIGKNATKGLGAGMNIDAGKDAVEENREEIEAMLKGADMVFVTCGLGGGTGTPGTPVVAEIARNLGALTIGVVTKPFSFEGEKRKEIAEEGLSSLKDKVDSLIVIPNDKVMAIIDEKTSFLNAFSIVDDILSNAVQAISDLIVKPGIINLDFADIKTIMKDSGWALMGVGKAKGEGRLIEAAKKAASSPLLEISIDGAKGVLFNISGKEDLSMKEIDEGARIITKSVDPQARVIFGTVLDESLRKGEVKVTVIATGFGQISEINKKTELKKNYNSPSLAQEEEQKESEWDVPAFLRKKEKN